MLTVKQRKALTRNKDIFLIKGAISNLEMIEQRDFKSLVLRGMLRPAILTLKSLLAYIQSSRYEKDDYLSDFNPQNIINNDYGTERNN